MKTRLPIRRFIRDRVVGALGSDAVVSLVNLLNEASAELEDESPGEYYEGVDNEGMKDYENGKLGIGDGSDGRCRR
jgi:hypothetical protein